MADVEHNTLAGTANMHGIHVDTVADAAALAALTPTSADVGKVYWQVDTDQLWFLKNDTPTWILLCANASGSIPGLMSAADFTKLSGVEALADVTDFANVSTALAAASSAVSFNSQQLQNVLDPTSAQHAATRNYVDTRERELARWVAINAPNSTADRWMHTASISALSNVEQESRLVVPAAGTMLRLIVRPNTITGLTANIVFTLRLNGSDTGLVFTGTSGNGYSGEATGTVAVVKGDILTLRVVQASAEAQVAFTPRATVTWRSAA